MTTVLNPLFLALL